ncbi:sensor histidine kinase [Aneurinibacillus tyrosinisolvens]|uniref:sensor histidine kinase n=1 Tax=Aneurinibacillus tyrosinisolvens TaxID=1443435 RepID=UPI00063F00D5|nr:HAMP domain-containing sensor histidine kinase [Aneurinibacillus tyrosinisolvens]
MFTSIFRRLLASYITIILVGFTLLAVLLNFSLQHFLIQQKEQVLYRQADSILELLQQVDVNPSVYPQFEKTISHNRRVANIKMDLLLLEDGSNLRSIPKMAKKLIKRNEVLNPSIIETVLSGHNAENVGPFKKSDNQLMLSIGVPVQKDGKVIGALFLHTPVREIQTGQITRLIIGAALIVAVPAVLVLYFVSRKISLPLVRMNWAVRFIGQGNFKERVHVEGKDEVAQLAVNFNHMAEQLEKMEMMRKELIANVSHELRTPLTSVRGFIQGMAEGVIPAEQQQRYLDISYRELNRLNTLLTTMLDLSAIESGRITLHPVPIRWSTLVESVGESVRVRMEEKSIHFHILNPEEANVKVFGDPERLKQVLFNLLDNAIRHTPEGGSITVSSRVINNQAEITVTDTGKGIEPEKLPLIWERFYTEKSARTSHEERSGLGLTITKHLVELMNGNITVDSAPGKGTTFTLYLPLPLS